MTNNVPNVCVDIYSQMANLLANFVQNSGIGNGGSETFTHGDGFVSESTDYLNNMNNQVNAVNFEDRVNDYCFYIFASLMVLFLAYQHFTNRSLEHRMNLKQNHTGQETSNNRNNDHGGDGVF